MGLGEIGSEIERALARGPGAREVLRAATEVGEEVGLAIGDPGLGAGELRVPLDGPLEHLDRVLEVLASRPVEEMARTSSRRPLNEKEEVREAVRRPPRRVRPLRIPSAMPSQKYSWSRSGLRSRKGRTAIDGSLGSRVGRLRGRAAEVEGASRRSRSRAGA